MYRHVYAMMHIALFPFSRYFDTHKLRVLNLLEVYRQILRRLMRFVFPSDGKWHMSQQTNAGIHKSPHLYAYRDVEVE